MFGRGAKILALLKNDDEQKEEQSEHTPIVSERIEHEENNTEILEDESSMIMDQGGSEMNTNKQAVSGTEVMELQSCSTMSGPLDVLINNNDLHLPSTSTFVQYDDNFSDCDDSIADKNYEPNMSDLSDASSNFDIEQEAANQTETEEIQQEHPKKKCRWKKATPENWKRQKNRKLRDECLPYENSKGILQVAKLPKPVDCSKCKLKCTEKFCMEERKLICRKYWILASYERKKDFILYNVTSHEPLSRRFRKDNAKRRQNSKKYYFNKDGEKLQVCQNFFMKTLCISNRVILSAFEGKDALGHFGNKDKRGRKSPSNKTKPEVIAKVNAHIESFPAMESHYTRKSSERKYLDCNLTITKMYELYKQQRQQDGDTDIASLITYRRVFCNNYNLSFFHPKKDQCLICSRYQQASPEEKQRLKEDYEQHLGRKNESQQAKAADKEKAKVDESFMSVTFDLQSVLQTPSSEVSLTYYMRKLTMYNFTVYEAAPPNKAFCYCWTEINGKKGSCEIGTCLWKYIQTLPPEVKHLSLFSDTCGGQNRNQQIAALLLYAVQNSHLEIIEQKFLESGHSFMEVDSMHSAIEQQKKFVSVYCVNDWMNIFKLARSQRGRNKNKPPYEVGELKFDEFFDLKQLATQLLKNKTIDENGQKINWLKVKNFKYVKDKPNYFQYRYDYSGEYVGIQISTTRRGRRPVQDQPCKDGLPKLYHESLKISNAKKKDLLTMCNKGVIPEIFHQFFQGIQSDNKVTDTLPDLAISDESEEEI
ncbi:unnamed protein product [Ceutorhynchus assimilis]|uniref:DUF7869 domain-containing protein n=1 Tax=Ceutorhynchus assimilis TaxID=467358 RepID=A0A9N9QRM0_9CUCU|nr:unnamed protein product [Ceutorhynchus assimilis]